MKPHPRLLLAVLAAVWPAAAHSQPASERLPQATLVVSGSGEARVAPDEATVVLGFMTQYEGARAAQDRVSQVVRKILAAMTALGIPKENIQTAHLTLTPAQQGYAQEMVRHVVGYRAANTVSIRLAKLDQGTVLDAGLEAGANQVNGVSFGLRNDGAARRKALVEAVREAREKAKTIAEALGVSVAAVDEVQEGGVFVHPLASAGGGIAMSRAEAVTPVSPGQVTVRASVTIRYRLGLP